MASRAAPAPAVILVVDDEAILRLTTIEILTDAGFTAIGAESADEAIAILESRADISAVFTDIEMPGSMDGLKLAAAIRNRWPPVRLIVTSGKLSPQDHDMPAGSQFFSKPYNLDHLVSALADLRPSTDG